MGVYIKGMKMPKSCGYCPLRHEARDGDECYLGALLTEYQKRPDDCPLVPVPPHVRLIEDEAVREQIDEWLDSVGDVVVGHGLSYYGELLGCIKDAPTIIPADTDINVLGKEEADT